MIQNERFIILFFFSDEPLRMSLRTRSKNSDTPVEFVELKDSDTQAVAAKPAPVRRSGITASSFYSLSSPIYMLLLTTVGVIRSTNIKQNI